MFNLLLLSVSGICAPLPLLPVCFGIFLSQFVSYNLSIDKPSKYLLWDTTVDPSSTTSACPHFPSFSFDSCSNNFLIPPTNFNTSLPNVISYGNSNCSSYDFATPLDNTFISGNYFFPQNAEGQYLIYSDALVRPVALLQSIQPENNNALGQVCMPQPDFGSQNQTTTNSTSTQTLRPPPPGGAPPPPGGPPPPQPTSNSSAAGSVPFGKPPVNRIYVHGFLADEQCHAITLNSTTTYFQATCSTKYLKYSCSDDQCKNDCITLNLSSTCSSVCVKVSDYKNTPLFGWGSPLLNALPVLSQRTISSKNSSPTGSTTEIPKSDNSIIIVAVSVSGSVLILAISVVFASLIISKRRRQNNSTNRKRSFDSSTDQNIRSVASSISESEITAKTISKARRQYKNAVKEAKKQQLIESKKSDVTSIRSGFSEKYKSSKHSNSTTPNNLNELTSSETSPNDDHSMMELIFRSDADKNHMIEIEDESINPKQSAKEQQKDSDSSNMFYQNAFAAAAQAAHTASMAAAMAASAATNAANIIAMVERRQNSRFDSEPKAIELDPMEIPDSSISVTSPDHVVTDFAHTVFGTPESQYGILGNESPNEFYMNTTSPSFKSLFNTIPPIVMASETMSTTTKLPDGTETTTIISRNMSTIGGNKDIQMNIEDSRSQKLKIKPNTTENVENSQARKVVAIGVHFAEKSNEIDLIVGDIVRLGSFGSVWSSGVNLRSGSEGKFPTKCVMLQ
ncbi:hypothetical protein HK096_004575 [Nowakowskiella sp. JEL0078]|nr:hypothetical protein HK096_004575 [Nowakowskiella sp. JEL0078]